MATAAGSTLRSRSLFVGLVTLSALFLHACREDPVKVVEALQTAGKPAQALQQIDRALTREQPNRRIYWDLALLKAQILKQRNRTEALAWLRSVDTQRAPSSDAAIRLIAEQATIESDLGRFHDADRDLTEALRLVPSVQARTAANLEVRRARALIGLGEPETAERCLLRAEEYARKSNDHSLDPYILHDRGQALSTGNRFEDAIKPLEQALGQFRQAKQTAANL